VVIQSMPLVDPRVNPGVDALDPGFYALNNKLKDNSRSFTGGANKH